MNEPFILVPKDFFSIFWWLWQWYNNSVYKVMMDLSGMKLPATAVLCDVIAFQDGIDDGLYTLSSTPKSKYPNAMFSPKGHKLCNNWCHTESPCLLIQLNLAIWLNNKRLSTAVTPWWNVPNTIPKLLHFGFTLIQVDDTVCAFSALSLYHLSNYLRYFQ